MKTAVSIILILGLIGASCSTEPKAKVKKEISRQDLVEIKDGHYTEWYPEKKQIKYEGELNSKGNREGKWNFYSQSGNLLSFSFYTDGKKNGHCMVKYPNGKIHYYGQYRNDQMVGEWVTYDQKGHKTIKQFDEGLKDE
jgi:antitoxin component YwqK of YwqJK toxin-antitoxin module